MIDLSTTTQRTHDVVTGVADTQLDAPTPMGVPVREVVQHLLGLTVAFRDAAGKVDGPTTNTPPGPSEDPLPEKWRAELGNLLPELAAAWQPAEAWTGMTRAGGIELPGEICGLVALNEVLLHGWDVARATGQDYRPTPEECTAVLPIVTPDEGAPDGSGREGLFGTVVPQPADAAPFDRVLGLAGRDPGWTP